jgi:hypothetical protein
VYQDRIQINYFSTPTQNIENFKESTEMERKVRLAQAHFRKTWFHREGKHAGKGKLSPPYPHDPSLRIWEGPLEVQELNEAVLIRDIKITAGGRLCPETLALAVKLKLPHNVTKTVEDETPAVNNSLFTYARHEICDCKRCKAQLSKREMKQSLQSCSCFLCDRGTLASQPAEGQ